MAYEIIKRLIQLNRQDVLDILQMEYQLEKNEKGSCIKYLLILLMRKVFTMKSFLIRSVITYIIIQLQVNGSS